jgi:prefoldin alpha subunit
MTDDLERVVQELRTLQAKANVLQERIGDVNEDLMQVDMTIKALTELAKVKSGESTYVPMGTGVWVKGTIGDTNTVLADVGAGIVVERTRVETIEALNEKKSQLTIIKNGFERDLKDVSEKGAFLQGKARKLAQMKEPDL